MYDRYRGEFQPSLREVSDAVKHATRTAPSSRLKTLESVALKLSRQTIRLSQVDDIAGCRIVVANLNAQERTVEALGRSLTVHSVVDRRNVPSFGYRAMHVIGISSVGYPVEVQIRTRVQDMWANLSESAASQDLAIKYGGGPPEIRDILDRLSEIGATLDELQATHLSAEAAWTGTAGLEHGLIAEALRQELAESNQSVVQAFTRFEQLVESLSRMMGR